VGTVQAITRRSINPNPSPSIPTSHITSGIVDLRFDSMWTSLPLTAGASLSAGSVMSNAELTVAVLDLGKMVAGIQSYLVSLGMQPTAPVSMHQPWMSPSPSPIPSYAMASTMGLVYTMASTPTVTTTVTPVPTTSVVVVPGVPSLQHPFTDGHL